MSKYKLGDPDYVIPDHGEAALRWEIGRLNEEVIPALEERIKELEAGTEKILTASAKKEMQALESIKALLEELKLCKEWGKLATARIAKLENLILKIRKEGPLADIVNEMIQEANQIAKERGGWEAVLNAGQG